MVENTYSFDLPSHYKSIIKVIGVGGGGSNAVNHMFNSGIRDVEFVVCNTDSQALQSSPVANKLQIGIDLTQGLGAGANPEKGRNAAIESKEDIREMLSDDTKMVFITAGMGGGTGTGAAPVIAQVAQELDILTVGIVTAPFGFEGRKKMNQANEGIQQLKEHCDTVLVVLNDKIKEIFGNLAIREAFAQADNVLTTAAKGIAEIITVPGYVNVDFEDVKTVMKNAGAAVMGSAHTSGDSRARRAAEMALNSPLLNNQNILGAEKILLSIMSGEDAELQMDELSDITDYMQEFAGDEAEVIFGHGIDSNLGENIRVTVIATGFASEEEMQLRTRKEVKAVSEPLREPESDRRLQSWDRGKKEEDEFEFEIDSIAPRSPEVDEGPKIDNMEMLKAELQQEIEIEEKKLEDSKRIFDLESSRQINLFSDENKDDTFKDSKKSFTLDMEDDDDFDIDPPAKNEERSNLSNFDFDVPGFEEEEPDEEKPAAQSSFTFEFEKPEPKDIPDDEEDDDDDFLSTLGRRQLQEEAEDEDLEELLEGPALPISRKVELMEERRIREEKLEEAKRSRKQEEYLNTESFKEKWDVPAYERKKVALRDVPHSSERNISKFNLTDDNQILGNNKFLHDNVD